MMSLESEAMKFDCLIVLLSYRTTSAEIVYFIIRV